MTIANSFKEYVELGDRVVIKVSLSELLKNDLTHQMFDEYMEYLNEVNFDIYEEHDGEQFQNEDYTKEYLDDQLNQLVRNFSIDRLRIIKVIQNELYGDKIIEQRKAEVLYNNKHNTKKAIGSVFIAGGTLLTIGTILFSGSISLIVLGIVTVTGGVILLVGNKE